MAKPIAFAGRYFLANDWSSGIPEVSNTEKYDNFFLYKANYDKMQFISDVSFQPRHASALVWVTDAHVPKIIVDIESFICFIRNIFSLTLNSVESVEAVHKDHHQLKTLHT